MILHIDRGIQKNNVYRWSMGIDFDLLIGQWEVNYVKDKKVMAEIDNLITNSPSKVFCVLHLKHPLLIEDYSKNDDDRFFDELAGGNHTKNLREYFALRLIHRKYEINLYEFGNRLF